jgi:hypothetical protein
MNPKNLVLNTSFKMQMELKNFLRKINFTLRLKYLSLCLKKKEEVNFTYS